MRDYTVKIKSPLGKISIKFKEGKIKEINFLDNKNYKNFEVEGKVEEEFSKVIEEFKNYFVGKKEDFKFSYKLIDLNFIDDFKKKVFMELLKVKWGEVITYSELAEKLGNRNLRRKVGRALSENPYPIIIPCHRVVGKNNLGGFSGGLDWKKKLLKLEGVNIK
ncbi:MAG: methylated-DNA--[protein]-cysteine S-methyltransferase [candidate division WOR-3 bacterium]